MDLNQLGDQLGEKLKETSSMTRTLACRILERVREFKENFSGWDSVSAWVPGTDDLIKKVYHRQPSRKSAVAKSAAPKSATKSPKAKTSSPKKSSAKARTKRPK